ncbi:MAG: DUF4097 domain-containing protein [Dehalococcoidia bacterium]
MADMTLRNSRSSQTRARRWSPVAVVITAGTALAGLALSIVLVSGIISTGSQTIEDHFIVGATPRLVVDADVDGDVTIQAGATESVSVEARLRDERRIDYQSHQDGDTIRIESREGGRFSFLPSWRRSADVTITAPAGTIVEVHAKNGDVVMDGLHNDATLRTTNGAIRLDDAQGNINATTTNGRITFDGAVPAGTSTRLNTTNGRLALRLSDAQGTIDAKSTNGRISFEGPLTGEAQAKLQTTNGGVDVRLTGTPNVTLDLDTSNASVTSRWPVLAEEMDDDTLKGAIGNGQAGLTVRSSNGEITVE